MSKIDDVLRRVAFILEDSSVSHEAMEMEAATILPQLAEMVRVAKLEFGRHEPHDWNICDLCGEDWPCATAKALTAMEKAAGEKR